MCILNELYEELKEKYQVEMAHNYSIISLVSNDLHKYDQQIKINKNLYELIHYSSNNLTVNYVVNSEITQDIIKDIHDSIVN
jgi:aspartokinase